MKLISVVKQKLNLFYKFSSLNNYFLFILKRKEHCTKVNERMQRAQEMQKSIEDSIKKTQMDIERDLDQAFQRAEQNKKDIQSKACQHMEKVKEIQAQAKKQCEDQRKKIESDLQERMNTAEERKSKQTEQQTKKAREDIQRVSEAQERKANNPPMDNITPPPVVKKRQLEEPISPVEKGQGVGSE